MAVGLEEGPGTPDFQGEWRESSRNEDEEFQVGHTEFKELVGFPDGTG